MFISVITLTVTFIMLQLTNTIAWSLWWVFSPLWIGAGIAALGEIVVLIDDYLL